MKALVLAASLAALTGVQVATAAPRVAAVASAHHSSAPMAWSGRLFPGDTRLTTIVGDVKSIYDEILARNPNFAHDTDGNLHAAGPHHTAPFPRDVVNGSDVDAGLGAMDCNAPSNPAEHAANWHGCNITYRYLQVIGKYGGRCTVPANTCRDIVCYNACRITVCNNWDLPFSPDCKDLGSDMERLHDGCPKHASQEAVADVSDDMAIFFQGAIKWPHHNTSVGHCPMPS